MKRIFIAALAVLLLHLSGVPTLAASSSSAKPVPSLRPAVSEKTAAAQEDPQWMLRLVNRENPIGESFVPDYEAVQNDFMMDKRVAPIAREMIADAQSQGVTLVVNSAYRPYSSQKRIYNAKIQEYLALGYSEENAKLMTELYVAVPGYSEHQLGLAVDIVAVSYQQLNSGYAETDAAKWLALNAPSYGFILRYPADKTEITHTAFEPWHFRYVGKPIAQEMTNQGLCLEEYIDSLKLSFPEK